MGNPVMKLEAASLRLSRLRLLENFLKSFLTMIDFANNGPTLIV